MVEKRRSLYGERNPYHKLTEVQVVEILGCLAAGESQASLGRRFGVGYRAIAKIEHRANWKHVEGPHFVRVPPEPKAVREPKLPITHCPAGHEYTAENTRLDRNGRRHCRECSRLRKLTPDYRRQRNSQLREKRRTAS